MLCEEREEVSQNTDQNIHMQIPSQRPLATIRTAEANSDNEIAFSHTKYLPDINQH